MYVNPVPRRATPRSRLNRPGSTHSRSSGLISRMRSIFDVTTTRASPIGVDAPASPVPLLEGPPPGRASRPRGRTRRRRRWNEEDHETGRALDHRRIACVEAERQGVRQHLVRTERSLELPPRRVQIRHVARVGRDGDLGRVRARRAGAGRVREGTARRAGLPMPRSAPMDRLGSIRWSPGSPSVCCSFGPRPQSQGRRGPPRRSLRPPLADGQPRRCGR